MFGFFLISVHFEKSMGILTVLPVNEHRHIRVAAALGFFYNPNLLGCQITRESDNNNPNI